jgi:hypothetical protein
MGAPTLETQLRNRVLKVAVPALLAVGVASVAMTSWLLGAADRDSARARAAAALHVIRAESAEGDPLEVAVKEAVESIDSEGVRVAIRAPGLAWRSGAMPMFPSALSLAPGACSELQDAESTPWVACSATSESFDAAVERLSTGSPDPRSALWECSCSLWSGRSDARCAVRLNRSAGWRIGQSRFTTRR